MMFCSSAGVGFRVRKACVGRSSSDFVGDGVWVQFLKGYLNGR